MKIATLAIILCSIPSLMFAKSWELVWSDEFDYTGLPDETKWSYEVGFVRNKELQYYTKARKENCRVEDGLLIIEGRKEEFKNPKYKPDSKHWQQNREYAEYTAASINTHHKAGWKYGRIEVRAKVPQGQGVWPAIWMMGTNRPAVRWPACGEIDIMEYVGKNPDTIHGNAHYSDDGKHKSLGGSYEADEPYEDFHIYAIEWDSKRINFFYDNKKYHSFPIYKAGKDDNSFRKPHYLLLNFAIGGSWGGNVDPDIFPQQYIIDYVRVYKDKNAGDE